MDARNNGTTATLRRSSMLRKKRMSNRSSKHSTMDSEMMGDIIGLEKRITHQRVFLYIQLNMFDKLPETAYPLELHLFHSKNTLQKMQDKYTKDTIIYQNEFSMNKPVFAMGVMQDDINDINTFSDNPLVITLYQRIPRYRKGHLKSINMPSNQYDDNTAADYTETTSATQMKMITPVPSLQQVTTEPSEQTVEAEVESEGGSLVSERLEVLSRGNCDLLQLFQRRRFISNVDIYLYPTYKHELRTQTSEKITISSHWHMYSILPMLKNFDFNNLVFITLESIYNVPDELHSSASDLGMSLSFRSKIPNERGDFHIVPICNFYSFKSQIISTQCTGIVWENIKRDYYPSKNISYLQMETNMRIKLPHLFRQLLATQGADLKTKDIDPLVDLALINNSLHRFVLNEKMRHLIESAIVNNNYDLLVHFFKDTKDNVLYEGIINPSIFGYPNVNTCRFATLLTQVGRTSITRRISTANAPKGPMFASIKICFFYPITQKNESLDKYNESVLKTAKLRSCFDRQKLQNEHDDEKTVVEEIYRAFDNLISDIISFIVKRDIKTVEQKRDYFCCQLGNLSNLLLKLCGADFNIRMPTKNNIEFRKMLTHMYKELIDRIENQFNSCSWENVCHCVTEFEIEQHRIVSMMNEVRIMCVIGEPEIAHQIYEELKMGTKNTIFINFYTFLSNVENLKFQAASQFFEQSKDGSSKEYFPSLVKVYVKYMIDLQSTDEAIVNEAFAEMIENLRLFASKNPLDTDAWILLYCIYNRNQYLPGIEFTRWKYENLQEVPTKNLSNSPFSLYELFLPINFEMNNTATKINLLFYESFKLFTRLGAYGFAEIVFKAIENFFTPVEAYLILTTLKMLQKNIDDNSEIKTFPTDDSERGMLMHYYQSHVNGNAYYSLQKFDEAIEKFQDLLETTESDTNSHFHLSLMRLAHMSFQRGNYELASQAFEMCVTNDKSRNNLMANYGKALSLYNMNRLKEASKYLSKCTEVDIFMPDVWGYLAIINLRLHANKRALECWKIAKLYPEIELNNHIYEELEKIKLTDIHLLVDDDGNPAIKSLEPQDFNEIN